MTAAQQLAVRLISEETPKEFMNRHVGDWRKCLHQWGYTGNALNTDIKKTYPFGSGRFVEVVVRRFRGPLKLAWSIRFFGSGPIYRTYRFTSALQADKRAYEIDVFMHKHKLANHTARDLYNLFNIEIP